MEEVKGGKDKSFTEFHGNEFLIITRTVINLNKAYFTG